MSGAENKDLLKWKLVAAGAALFYLYKVTKANGGTLKGNPMGVQIQSENIVKLASNFVPPEFRGHARKVGNQIMNRILES